MYRFASSSYWVAIFSLFLGLPALILAQTGPQWTVESVIKQEFLSGVDIHPEGQKVLWVKRYPDQEKDRLLSDLYLTFIQDSAETIRLTRTGNNRNPAWSPSGHRISFLSNRSTKEGQSAKTQVWLMDPRGGEPEALTKLENGVNAFDWLDPQTIIFTAREDKTNYEETLTKAKDDALVVEDTTLYWPIRLFSVDIKTRKIKRLTDNTLRIGAFAPSPDGRYVIYSLNRSPITADARTQPHQYLLDLETGTTTEVFTAQYFDPGGFQWALDSQGFYASDQFSSDPEHEGAGITELYFFDLATMSHEKIPLDWDWAVGFGGYAVTQNGVHVQLADGARMKPRHYRRTNDGWTYAEVTDARFTNSTSIIVGPDGQTVVFDYSHPTTLPQYLYGRYQNGEFTEGGQLVRLNQYLKKLPMPRSEVIEWAGHNDETVNGVLYYPLNYQPGRRYPLMVVIHGGPAGADLDAWRLSWTVYPGIWAQKGAFVLRPNYHGSGNHGLDFVESIKGRYYELEVPDIVRGVEHLIAQNMVDADSLGVMGWSNGAILAIALTIEHPTMFKAAAPGAGDVNWTSDYGNCSFGVRFDNSYFKGPPWEEIEHYIEKSPLFRMERVVTPTLIFFGTEDRAVPTEQGWQHYRAMQQIGKAPVRFLLFPGQPHGLQRLSHQKRKMEEEIAWFDQYLFGTQNFQENLATRTLPGTSPLALLDRKKTIARSNGHLGTSINDILAPETVLLGDSLSIGRFEVTRAQFAVFQGTYRYVPGTDDYPANAISFEDAKAYVAWLSNKTGRAYRLPTEAELNTLRALAGPQENNLAYWASYNPNPDEWALLQNNLDRYTPDDLLMPAGMCPPGNASSKTGPLMFDVNGNVAEWAVTKDGKGKAMTLSAVDAKDDKARQSHPTPAAYIGLRVVRDLEE